TSPPRDARGRAWPCRPRPRPSGANSRPHRRRGWPPVSGPRSFTPSGPTETTTCAPWPLGSGCGPEALEAAVEVFLQVLEVLEAAVEAHQRPARRKVGRGAGRRAVDRDGEALVAAPGIAEAEQFEPVEHRGDGGL